MTLGILQVNRGFGSEVAVFVNQSVDIETLMMCKRTAELIGLCFCCGNRQNHCAVRCEGYKWQWDSKQLDWAIMIRMLLTVTRVHALVSRLICRFRHACAQSTLWPSYKKFLAIISAI